MRILLILEFIAKITISRKRKLELARLDTLQLPIMMVFDPSEIQSVLFLL